jgi:hypothetical protein
MMLKMGGRRRRQQCKAGKAAMQRQDYYRHKNTRQQHFGFGGSCACFSQRNVGDVFFSDFLY